MEGLRPFQLYRCTVTAETVDEGPHSAAVFVTTAEDGEIHDKYSPHSIISFIAIRYMHKSLLTLSIYVE